MLKLVLEILHGTHTEGLGALQRVVEKSVLPRRVPVASERFSACDKAVALLHRTQPSILQQHVPVFVLGDGNCLFRSVSLACYGTEAAHCILRARSAAEMLLHPEWYDASRADSRHPLRSEPEIVLPEYEEECLEIACLGQAVGVTAVLALSAIIGYPIHTFWPPLNGSVVASPLTRVHIGRGVTATAASVHLMWSTTGSVPKTGAVHINHFVPLLPKTVTVDSVAILSDGDEGEGDVEKMEPVAGCDVHVDSESSVLQEGDVAADDGTDVLMESDNNSGFKRSGDVGAGDVPTAKRLCVTVDENDGSVADGGEIGEEDSVALGDNCVQSVPLQFKTAEQLVDLLTGTVQVHAEVPRGVKENVWFVVDNTGNVKRHEAGQKNVYWDDCGIWSSKDGRTLTTHYVRTGDLLSVVKLQYGKVCRRQMVKGKRQLVPMVVQPEIDDIVTVYSYYATLKADSRYRKRVSWLVSCPNLAVYEYQGRPPPVNAGHGLQRKVETEFVRTKPEVLQKIRAGLQEKKAQPRQVYEQQMLANESSNRPRSRP